MMLSESDVVAFIATDDLVASRSFYRDSLGLHLVVDESPIACVFACSGTTLRVTAVSEVVAVSYAVLGWRVSDIELVIDDLVGRDVRFLRFDGMAQDERDIWTSPSGDCVAWFSDPAGNTLSVTEFKE